MPDEDITQTKSMGKQSSSPEFPSVLKRRITWKNEQVALQCCYLPPSHLAESFVPNNEDTEPSGWD